MASFALVCLWLGSSVLIVLGVAIHSTVKNLPQLFNDILLFGKVKETHRRKKWTIARMIEVPKSWFTHFYFVGVLVNGFMTAVAYHAYVRGEKPFIPVVHMIEQMAHPRTVSTAATSGLLLMAMMVVQNVRRLCECLFVSKFSSSTMNVFHYVLGILLYSFFSFAVLAETPPLLGYTVKNAAEFVEFRHFVGLILFAWSSWQQFLAHATFAKLRVKGDRLHHIPRGGLFQYVSCPHYLAEILIYVSFLVVAGWRHVTVLAIVIFVVSNQLASAFLVHRWYRRKFLHYPATRRAVIPFVF